MSTVFLHVGQCGNQLGQVFWGEVVTKWSSSSAGPSSGSTHGSKSATAASSSVKVKPKVTVPYGLLDGSLPRILVDSEHKVIRQCVKQKKSLQLSEDFCIDDRAGCGNNWACGYYGRKKKRGTVGVDSGCGQEDLLINRVLESVRKLVERCDRFGGFVMFHSIAGGTGSGLGSALLQHLRAEYPLCYLITVTVSPFSLGETPLQHLNSLLCLSWLQAYSDAVLLFGNDSVLEQARKHRSAGAGSKVVAERREDGSSVSVEDMNRHISGILCNAFMPIWRLKQKVPNLAFQEPWDLIRSLCPDPKVKLITSRHAHFTSPTTTWSQAVKDLLHNGPNRLWKRTRETKTATSAMVLIGRGSRVEMEEFQPKISSLFEAKLKKAYSVVDWNPFPIDYWLSLEPKMMGHHHSKLASILANSSVVLDYVETVQERASVMFKERAYLHWYERYGCGQEDFEQAFECVQGIVDNYKEL